MKPQRLLIHWSVHHPIGVFILSLLLVIATAFMFPRVHIDTDPENMLPAEQSDRVRHHQIKHAFDLSDIIVVGIVNESDPDGVFNSLSLRSIEQLTRAIEQIEGVVRKDVLSLASADNIKQEDGTLRFEWLMHEAPEERAAALAIRSAVERLPMMRNTLVSSDGRAAAIYVPIASKDESYRIAETIQRLSESYQDTNTYYITGLPVAEDTFGVEMFKQMAMSAPMAGVLIFALMWLFFRSVSLVVGPMLVAMATVIITMGTLIGSGFTVHIMSSMIPIFLMPIAVVDSIHILSSFCDRYQPDHDVKSTLEEVMEELFTPMLFTSLTSAVGFASLMFTPIPPVQVFGGFVALGILLAFILTITLIPAYTASLPKKRLVYMAQIHHRQQEKGGRLDSLVAGMEYFALNHSKIMISVVVVLSAIAAYGISTIQINDNPVRWFSTSHRIQVADRVLNEHFAGTYNAYLVLDHKEAPKERQKFLQQARELIEQVASGNASIQEQWHRLEQEAHGETDFIPMLQMLQNQFDEKAFASEAEEARVWGNLLDLTDNTLSELRYFQQPAILQYIAQMQLDLEKSPLVGKTNSVADIVRTVYRELQDGRPENYRVPDSQRGVAQALLSFQTSHRPYDLWHMVTPDYRSSAIWFQLTSGDNQHMSMVIELVDDYISQHPLPSGVEASWGGLTYINVVWQDAMVKGMVKSLLGSFVAVFVIMLVLFRSVLFGLLAMVPLSVTITLIYGLIGFVGKDYDMPVAILSSLTLGLSIDFAIHFLQHARHLIREENSFEGGMRQLFGEPARAITRNAIVIAIGFSPLLVAPLVPYKTVGTFMALLMAFSGLVTLLVLPALLKLLQKPMFGSSIKEES